MVYMESKKGWKENAVEKCEQNQVERERKTNIDRKSQRNAHAAASKTRAEIILRASNGEMNKKIEREMKKDAKTVRLWRYRYIKSKEKLRETEASRPHKMRATIESVLSDEQRAGGPTTYKPEQVAAIVALSCKEPVKLWLPFSHWSPRLLRLEAIKLGIVEDISERQTGRSKTGG